MNIPFLLRLEIRVMLIKLLWKIQDWFQLMFLWFMKYVSCVWHIVCLVSIRPKLNEWSEFLICDYWTHVWYLEYGSWDNKFFERGVIWILHCEIPQNAWYRQHIVCCINQNMGHFIWLAIGTSLLEKGLNPKWYYVIACISVLKDIHTSYPKGWRSISMSVSVSPPAFFLYHQMVN